MLPGIAWTRRIATQVPRRISHGFVKSFPSKRRD
jgi:hypothetical protein